MNKCTLAVSIVLWLSNIASAGSTGGVIGLSLSPDIVHSGETISGEITLTGDDVDHYLRIVQFDFSLSDVDHQNFAFEYNTVLCQNFNLCGVGHTELNLDGDVPATVYSSLNEDQAQQILLPGDGSAILIGTFTIDTTGLGIGQYTMDVLNAEAPNDDFGEFSARLDFGFGNGDPYTTWSAFNGLLTGGSATFVVPEPGSLGLLGLGAFATVRRRW